MLGSNMCRLEKAGSDGWQAGSLGPGEEGRVPGAAGGEPAGPGVTFTSHSDYTWLSLEQLRPESVGLAGARPLPFLELRCPQVKG